uniref:Caspase recruitment domain family member 8 n=1 Tax=Gorilla gorilla gorilla TaxID=9595 RepID=A0A2I2ZP49_GORGO
MEKKECPEKSSSSEEELLRRDSGSSRNIDASKLIRLQGPRKLLVDDSIRELQYTKTGIFLQAEACVTNDTVYRELPRVSEIRCDISHFFQEDDETEAEPLLFRAVPECQLSGRDIPRVSEDQESSEGQDSGAVSSEEDKITSCFAAKVCFEVKQDYTNHQFLGPEGVWFPTAGWYLWPATGLGFLVRDAVTVTIAFGSWNQHLALDLQHHEQWLVGGPLFDVTAEPEEAVAEIHLPHFISLQAGEVDVSWFLVAHFKDEGMVLEHPARVEPFYAVLEKPSFSLMGILLRIASGTCLSIPITSNTLIYYHPHPEDIKFHLYLVPSDALLTKAIDDEEDRFHGVRLQTSPPVEPLNFGSSYIVSNSANLKVMPKWISSLQ